MVITDGCAGLARALETVYPRTRHQGSWVEKMRNILEKVWRRAWKRFRFHWRRRCPAMVGQLERDLSELLHFFAFPRHLWRKLRPTSGIERCFGEVRRSTRPMVVFTNVESVDRIISAIFSLQRGLEKPHPLTGYTSNLTSRLRSSLARLRQHCYIYYHSGLMSNVRFFNLNR